MKAFLHLLIGSIFVSSASAEFRTWTRNDGKTAELDLVSVSGEGADKAGEFKMRNGRSITLQASVLSEADAKLLEEWQTPSSAAADDAPASVFDDVLDGNLVKLEGKSLRAFRDLQKPKKFYVFYYTASWCGPCQQFTPSLVEFYKKHKTDNFEIVLITSDDDEGDMEDYAAEKKMPWPQLKLSKVEKFEKKFDHEVSGIPSVIVCKLDGEKLGNYRDLAALEKLVK